MSKIFCQKKDCPKFSIIQHKSAIQKFSFLNFPVIPFVNLFFPAESSKYKKCTVPKKRRTVLVNWGLKEKNGSKAPESDFVGFKIRNDS